MSTFIKGEKITDHYKLEDELGRYSPLSLTLFLISSPLVEVPSPS
jgi:hypothetical protein